MYLNSNVNNNTDINNKFEENIKNEKSPKKSIKIFIIIGLIILLIIIIFIYKNNKNKAFVLKGEEDIIIYKGSEYIEPGYSATNMEDVEVNGVVDTSMTGEYIIVIDKKYFGEDGTIKKTKNDHARRNSLCQIDKNNFVFITNKEQSGLKEFNFYDLANYMASLECQVGFNFDGGGSIDLLYKSSKSTKSTLITGGDRHIADIIYFHQ